MKKAPCRLWALRECELAVQPRPPPKRQRVHRTRAQRGCQPAAAQRKRRGSHSQRGSLVFGACEPNAASGLYASPGGSATGAMGSTASYERLEPGGGGLEGKAEPNRPLAGLDYIASYADLSERQLRRTLWMSALKRAWKACTMCALTMALVWLAACLLGIPGPASRLFYYEQRSTSSSVVFIAGVLAMSVLSVWGEMNSIRNRNDDARRLLESFSQLRAVIARDGEYARRCIGRAREVRRMVRERRRERARIRSRYDPEVIHGEWGQVSFRDSPMAEGDAKRVASLEAEVRKLEDEGRDMSLEFQGLHGIGLDEFEQRCEKALMFEDSMARHITGAMLRAVRAMTTALAIVIGVPPSAHNILSAIVVIQNVNSVFFVLLS